MKKTTKNITNIVDRARYENYGVGTDQSDREWFIKPLQTGKIHVTNFYISKMTGALCITVSAPIVDDKDEMIGIFGAGTVMLKPAPEGTGVIAGGAVRAVMEAVGIKNICAKCLRSNNPQNVVKATMAGLTSLRSPEQVAAIRGKSVEQIVG